jgi:SAM-dependent methyltransferase
MSAPAPPDPAPLIAIASGFMAAKHLFAAAEVGLFAALAEGPASLEELARRAGLPRRTARVSADAMVALGVLERDGGRYANGPEAAFFLSGATPADLRPWLRFWDRLSYPGWAGLAEALRAGRGRRPELTGEEGEVFAAGVEAITAGSAHAVAETPELQGRARLLDVGGGTGSFLAAALERHSDLSGTLVEIPPVVDVARARLAASPFAERTAVVDADALADPLPDGHDAILVANVAHLLSPEGNRRLLSRLREAAAPGAVLLCVDFWTDATHTDPPIAALMAGEFLAYSDEGDIYSADEISDWLAETGWTVRDRRPAAGPQSVILAEAPGP